MFIARVAKLGQTQADLSSQTIHRRHAWEIVLGAYETLKEEPSLVEVTIPEGEVADIVGDTHGQFFE